MPHHERKGNEEHAPECSWSCTLASMQPSGCTLATQQSAWKKQTRWACVYFRAISRCKACKACLGTLPFLQGEGSDRHTLSYECYTVASRMSWHCCRQSPVAGSLRSACMRQAHAIYRQFDVDAFSLSASHCPLGKDTATDLVLLSHCTLTKGTASEPVLLLPWDCCVRHCCLCQTGILLLLTCCTVYIHDVEFLDRLVHRLRSTGTLGNRFGCKCLQ